MHTCQQRHLCSTAAHSHGRQCPGFQTSNNTSLKQGWRCISSSMCWGQLSSASGGCCKPTSGWKLSFQAIPFHDVFRHTLYVLSALCLSTGFRLRQWGQGICCCTAARALHYISCECLRTWATCVQATCGAPCAIVGGMCVRQPAFPRVS
jgi:hypothetical protein